MPGWLIELAFRVTGLIYRTWKKTPVEFRDRRPIVITGGEGKEK